MNVFDEYLNVFSWINTTTIIIGTVILGALMLGISIIKYNIYVNLIKKSVKEAVRELDDEKAKKAEEIKNTTEIL